MNKNFIFLFAGRFLQAIVSVFTLRLMTEFLAPSEVGHQYIINSMILWFSLVLVNPVGMFVNRHVHQWHREKALLKIIKKLNLYFLSIAVISLPVVYFVRQVFHFGTTIEIENLLIYIAIYIYFSTWFQTLSSFFNLFEFQKQFVSLNVLSQTGGLIFSIIFVKWGGPTGLHWLSGLLLGQILALGVGLFLYQKYFPKDPSDSQARLALFDGKTFYFCFPVAVATLFMWVLSQGYRLYVEKSVGLEALASLGVGLGIAASVAAVVEALTTQFYYPRFYSSVAESSEEARKEHWMQLWKDAVGVYIPCGFLTIAAAPFLVRVLTSIQFRDVTFIVALGSLIEMFRQMSNIAYLASHAEKKTKNTVAPYMVGAGLLIGSLILLNATDRLSLITILYSLVLAGLTTLLGHILSVQRMLRTKIPYSNLFNKILLSLPLLLVFYLNSRVQSILIVFLTTCLAGFYCLGLIWKSLKPKN